MSTLAAARADNFYFSKNYDPSKVKPRKSDLEQRKPFVRVQGQAIRGKTIRYETPFHVRCKGCQNMIAKGVRFNAVQKWVDNFHTTEIYEFFMKCPQCPMKIVVRTDPENCEYKYLEGAYRIFQTEDCTDQDRIRDTKVLEKIAEDPFFRLENQHVDKQKNEMNMEIVEKLEQQQKRGLNDFELNRMLRKKIKEKKNEQKQYNSFKKSKNLQNISVLEEDSEDEEVAARVSFRTKPIKKQDKPMTERDILKEKVSKMHPSFKRILKKQIKLQNKPSTTFVKK